MTNHTAEALLALLPSTPELNGSVNASTNTGTNANAATPDGIIVDSETGCAADNASANASDKPSANATDNATGKTRQPDRPHRRDPMKHSGRYIALHESDVTRLARRYTVRAIQTIAGIMNETRNPAAVKLRAAQELLGRGWGPAVGPSAKSVPEMSPEDMVYAANKLRETLRAARISRKALPLWAKAAKEHLDNQRSNEALWTTLTENAAACLVAGPTENATDKK